MTITAKILADSVHRRVGRTRRLTTFELRYPRFIHAEMLTPRLFSRNSASSRAIPIERVIRDVLEDPADFVFWGKNQPGMQAAVELGPAAIAECRAAWLDARTNAVFTARQMLAQGAHKQNVNRLLEPWSHITVVLSATDFANFYHLRRDAAAQPEMRALANAMFDAHHLSVPVDRTNLQGIDEWHLPFVTDEERREWSFNVIMIAVGRAARVSYLTHNGKRDPAADIELAQRLERSGHWSPFEHVARPYAPSWLRRMFGRTDQCGNFAGWQQQRKMMRDEHPYTEGQIFP